MKYKIAELSGAKLDWAVMRCYVTYMSGPEIEIPDEILKAFKITKE